MSVFEYQRVLARLVVDDEFYEQYSNDPPAVASKLGVEDSTRELLAGLDQIGVKRFRDVIQGSRSTTFHLVLDELSSRLPNGDWVALIRAFHRDVVLKDSSKWNDLSNFCDWLEGEYPRSRGATIARYQYLTQVLGSARPNTVPSGTVKTSSKVTSLTSWFDFEQLFDDSIPLWQMNGCLSRHDFLIKGTYGADDFEVLEVDAHTLGVLELLLKPRTMPELEQRLNIGADAVVALMDQFSALSLVDGHKSA